MSIPPNVCVCMKCTHTHTHWSIHNRIIVYVTPNEKMSTNFKYNLNKSLKKYAKYIPQLSKPVLRVLIQGQWKKMLSNARPLGRTTIFHILSQWSPLNNHFQSNFSVSVHYIESRNCPSEVLDIALNKLSHTGCEIPENFYELFSACIQIMQLFLRTPKGSVKNEELREGLRELRFSEECIDDICKVLHNHRDSLTQNYCEVKSLRTAPKRINWCINLSLIER